MVLLGGGSAGSRISTLYNMYKNGWIDKDKTDEDLIGVFITSYVTSVTWKSVTISGEKKAK